MYFPLILPLLFCSNTPIADSCPGLLWSTRKSHISPFSSSTVVSGQSTLNHHTGCQIMVPVKLTQGSHQNPESHLLRDVGEIRVFKFITQSGASISSVPETIHKSIRDYSITYHISLQHGSSNSSET